MKKRCWIFDIDGTLADCTHRKHHIEKEPKDWEAFFAECHKDQVIPHVADILRSLVNDGDAVVFASGRSDGNNVRELTEDWLALNFIDEPVLYMRKEGDHRDDSVVKLELLAQIRADGFAVIAVFDDRNSVVKMWREAGIPCFQVAEGDF